MIYMDYGNIFILFFKLKVVSFKSGTNDPFFKTDKHDGRFMKHQL